MDSSDPKPQRLAILLYRVSRGGEQYTRRFHPQLLDRARRRLSHGRTIVSEKAAFTHSHPRRKRRDGKILGEMAGYPTMKAIEFTIALLRREHAAELRLPAGAPEEHHQIPRNRHCCGVPDVVLDHGERQVDPGGDTRGGPHVAIANEDRVDLDMCAWEAAGQQLAVYPMRHHAPAIQEARRSQQERPGADAFATKPTAVGSGGRQVKRG